LDYGANGSRNYLKSIIGSVRGLASYICMSRQLKRDVETCESLSIGLDETNDVSSEVGIAVYS
jgi:hypothetical protein